MTVSIEEAVRLSHCSAGPDAGHKCMGTCTIKPDGTVLLTCTLCGDDTSDAMSGHRFLNRKAIRHAITVLSAAGMAWDGLSAETQLEVVRAIRKNECPGCGALDFIQASYLACSCGEYTWDSCSGWKKRDANARRERNGAAEPR